VGDEDVVLDLFIGAGVSGGGHTRSIGLDSS
jgi:hypothetical protein